MIDVAGVEVYYRGVAGSKVRMSLHAGGSVTPCAETETFLLDNTAVPGTPQVRSLRLNLVGPGARPGMCGYVES